MSAETIPEYQTIDSVGHYLDQIGKVALLDAADEVRLARDIEAGLYAARLLEQEAFASLQEMADLQEVRSAGERAKPRQTYALSCRLQCATEGGVYRSGI